MIQAPFRGFFCVSAQHVPITPVIQYKSKKMKTISYLIVGILCIFVIITFMVTKTEMSTLIGIIIGAITLALIPLILLTIRKTPRRDPKHQDSDHFDRNP